MDEDHVKNEHVEEQETKTKSHKYILFIKEYKTKFLIGVIRRKPAGLLSRPLHVRRAECVF